VVFGSITKVSSTVARITGVAVLLFLLSGCGGGSSPAPVIGQAYVGPAVLKIRKDIPLQSPTVATVKHGDLLEILQRRRRFFRVRTPGGAEGWTDERQLLSADDMANLKELAARAAKMPVQGQGTSYNGDLNVHMQPDRLSASFLLIKEKEKVDVLGHMYVPRVEQRRKPLLPPTPKKARVPRKPPRQPKYPPPPMPKPPIPPANWLDLSKTDPDPDAPPPEDASPPKPVPIESWSLVRTRSGQTGWVLTRRLQMTIPDDVAQYAEGRRIVSYFALAETVDGDQKKPTWLWTTVGSGPQPYDFDSFRVFVWSLRRHRYETAYIERNLQGYSPVLLKDVELSSGSRSASAPATAKYPGFSICIEKDDGQRYRREYALLGNLVRFAGDRPCEAVPPLLEAQAASPTGAAAQPAPSAEAKPGQNRPQQTESFGQRLKKRLRALTRGWLGG
jgi:hypothetical protein